MVTAAERTIGVGRTQGCGPSVCVGGVSGFVVVPARWHHGNFATSTVAVNTYDGSWPDLGEETAQLDAFHGGRGEEAHFSSNAVSPRAVQPLTTAGIPGRPVIPARSDARLGPAQTGGGWGERAHFSGNAGGFRVVQPLTTAGIPGRPVIPARSDARQGPAHERPGVRRHTSRAKLSVLGQCNP